MSFTSKRREHGFIGGFMRLKGVRLTRLIAAAVALVMVLEVLPLHVLASPFKPEGNWRIKEAPGETVTSFVYGGGSGNSTDAGASPQSRGIIVSFRQEPGKMMSEAAVDVSALGAQVLKSANGLQLVQVESGKDPDSVLKALRQSPSVAYAEPNYLLHSLEDPPAPNDPRYNEQWGLEEMEITYAWQSAGEILDGNQPNEVKVMVVDTGIDAGHSDLFDRMLTGRNVITGAPDPNDTNDDSTSGHGTHIAGIIGAATGNGTGVAGVAGTFPVKVVPIKALDAAGVGTMYDVAQGIRWGADNGARVINLSLGARLPDFPQTLSDAVRYAQDCGALVVAAAGNDGKGVEGFYPACLPGVVSAGATGPDHKAAPFSNWGPRNILAPGVGILSPLPSMEGEENYGVMTGTSQAAAMVSGTAALLWSVLPNKDAAQMQESLRAGQKRRLSEDGRYYSVLSADKALDELQENTGAEPYLLAFISPDPDTQEIPRLTGIVDLTVKVGNPSALDRVAFTMWPEGGGEETVLGNVYADGFTEGGYGTLQWDTNTVPDGSYEMSAVSYNPDGDWLSRDGIDIVVANHQETGLILEIKKPDGTKASGAWVTVHHPFMPLPDGEIDYEELWNGPADLDGKVMIPSSIATGGNDFLVTARGTGPSFFYYKIVRAPERVTLDATGATLVTISARRVDGRPLSGAVVLAEMLEANLPKTNNPTAVVHFNDYENETNMMPLLQLGALGTGSITMTPGHYNIRAISATDKYYLFTYDRVISESNATVEFHPLSSDVSTLRFEPDERCCSASLLLTGESDPYFYGFEEMAPGDEVTVTPGIFRSEMDACFRQGSREWFFGFYDPEIRAEGGQMISLGVGGLLSATVAEYFPNQEYVAGQDALFSVKFQDSYGNHVRNLAYQPYSASSSHFSETNGNSDVAGIVALGGDQIEENRAIVKPTSRGSWDDDLSDIEQPSETLPSSEMDSSDTSRGRAVYAFDVESSSFQLVPQAKMYVSPQVEISDAQGNIVIRRNASWASAWWPIPSDITAGAYSSRVTLLENPLGPDETGGKVISPDYSFEVKPAQGAPEEPPSELTVTVLKEGEPVSGIDIHLALFEMGAYYTFPGVNFTTDQEGKAEINDLSYLGLGKGDKIALIAYGNQTIENSSGFLFKVKTLTLGEPPMSTTIDTGPLKKVSLTALGQDGNQLSSAAFSIYGMDDQGIACGLILPDYGGGYVGFWLPAGDYLFQARQQQPIDTGNGPCVYYLTKSVTVPQEVPAGGLPVTIESSGAAAFTVTGPPSAGDEIDNPFNAVAVSLFTEYLPQAPVFSVGKSYVVPTQDEPSQDVTLYVTPGTYHLEGILVQDHYDGHWDYWLDRDQDVSLPSGGSFNWSMGAQFDVESTTVTCERSSYEIGESVGMDVYIGDGQGNRLVAMGINMQMGGGGWYENLSSLAAWRLPGRGQILVPQSLKAQVVPEIGEDKSPASSSDNVGAQNHDEIAPFLTVLDPQGNQVSRQKDAGWNYDLLDLWSSSPWGTPWGAIRLDSGSTFFSGTYEISEDAVGGTYKAILELETGPTTSLRRETTFTVNAVHASPVLYALKPFISTRSVKVTGETLAGAQVNLYLSHNGGEESLTGTATADAEGRFGIEVALDAEGVYGFTATSTLGGKTSPHSAPVYTTVDWTKPAVPSDLSGTPLDSANVRLTWAAPEADIAFYRIKRDGALITNEVTGGETLQYLDGGLEPLKEYQYQVIAVDRAGNESDPAEVSVTTLAAPDQIPPTPPVNLVAALSGFRVDLRWESATDNIGVVGYRVYRAIKVDGAAQPSAPGEWDLKDPETTAFKDPDLLDASTTYVYTVVAYDAAGNESIKEGQDEEGRPAAVVEITTPPLCISFIRWSAPREKNGLLIPDSDAQGKRPSLTITMKGDPSRRAKATVDLAGPSGGLTDLLLTEDKDDQGKGLGVYRGSLPIPEGTARIVGITGIIEDESGHSAVAPGSHLPEDFSGALSIRVEPAQGGAVGSAELKAWSQSLGAGATLAISGPGDYVLNGLAPAGDYSLTLKTSSAVILAEEKGLTVLGGVLSRVVMKPEFPATLSVRVVGAEGQGLGGVVVSVSSPDGTPLAQGPSFGGDGRVALVYAGSQANSKNGPALKAGSRIVVAATPPRQLVKEYMGIAGSAYVLLPGPNEITLRLPAQSKATLSGVVTSSAQSGGTPLKGACVAAYQTLEGQETFVGSDWTSADGRYSLDLLAGATRLVVSHRLTGSREIRLDSPLTPAERRTFDIELPMSQALILEVYTRRLGQSEFLMDMDWRVAVHLHLSVRNRGQEGKPKNYMITTGYGMDGRIVSLRGAEPGDRLEIIADGREAGMTRDAVTVTLDENSWAKAQIHLVEKGTIKAIVRDISGNEHPRLARYVQLYKIGEGGPAFSKSYEFRNESVTLSSLDEGTYTAVFHWDALPSVINAGGIWIAPSEDLEKLQAYLGSNCVVMDNITFEDGSLVDLGIVNLPLPTSALPGLFRGHEGNDLTPSRLEAGPGEIITMRGSYRYDGSSAPYDLRLCFGIPQGARLVEGSVVVTPREGLTPEAASRIDAVELRFGSYEKGPLSGTVIYRLEMPEDPDLPACTAKMWAEYGGGRGTTEDIAAVTIKVPYVSLTVPGEAWAENREVPVSGKATPGATVRIYDGGYFLAETQASASGTWKTTVVLPDRGQPANHFLRAEVILASTADDTEGPVWPEGASLTISSIGREKADLTWPEASDPSGVSQYVVTAYLSDGSVGLTRTSAGTQLAVEGLNPATSYTFKVQALDEAGNWSRALSADATSSPPDSQAPSWPGGASLAVSEMKFTSVKITWPSAADNEAVKEYRVSCTPPAGTAARPIVVPANNSTVVVEHLTRNTTYVFTVEAVDPSGNSSQLETLVKTLDRDTEMPVWPQGTSITATRVLDTEVALTWTEALDNVGIYRYPILQQEPDGSWRQVSCSYAGAALLTQLRPETTYTFKAVAQDQGGNQTTSGLVVSVTTSARDRTPPNWAPEATVTVSDKTQDGFLLSWPVPQDASGVGSYQARFIDPDLHTEMAHCTSGPSLRLSGLERGRTYSYKIFAADTRGNWTQEASALSIDVLVQPEDQTPPSWPQDARLDVPEVGLHSAELRWTPAVFAPEDPEVGLPAYHLKATDNAAGNMVFGTTVGRTITEWAVGNLEPGRTYTLKVEAIDRWGNVSSDGPSETVTVPTSDTQAPRWPQGAILEVQRIQKNTADDTYTVMLGWPQAKDFELHYYIITAVDLEGHEAPSSPTTTQQPAWHMWGLDPGKTYTIQVNARDLSGNTTTDGPIATVMTPGAGVQSMGAAGGSSFTAQNGESHRRAISSVPVMVAYDPDLPRVTKMTMRQKDGRLAEFQPIGKFPYVFVPGMAFDFSVEFSDPTRVSDLRVHSANGAELKASGSGSYQVGQPVRISGRLSGRTTIPGMISASYTVAPAPWSSENLPPHNEAVERSGLPSVWRDANVSQVPYDDGNADTLEAKMEGTLGDPRMSIVAAMVFSPAPDFVPNRETEAATRNGAPPVNNLQWSVTKIGNDRLAFQVSCVIPAEEVVQLQGQMTAQGWLDTPGVLVKIFGETAVHGGLALSDLIGTVTGATDYQNYCMDLDDLLMGIDPSCPDMARYRERIEMEKESASYRTYTKAGLGLLSLGLGVVIPGLGFAIGSFVAGKLIEAAIDAEQQDMFNDIKNDIDMNDFCRPKESKRDKKSMADPTWILDPSGFVYEVVPENRVEGVTATALHKVGGVWMPWDATWFEQDNPLATDAEGRYAWDVPEGDWKVAFEKTGYRSAESYEMHVPPPHTDVNVAMVSSEAPLVANVNAAFGGNCIELTFNKHMNKATLTSGTVTVTELDESGEPKLDEAGAAVTVKGLIEAGKQVSDPNEPSVILSRVFRFIPDLPLSAGGRYRVWVSHMAEAYNGMSMTQDYICDVTVTTLIRVEGVRLNRDQAELSPGETITLAATVVPNDATDQSVIWSTDNPAVATVDSNGKITAVAVGRCVVEVTTQDGGFKDSCHVTVTAAPSEPPPSPGPGPSSPTGLLEERYVVGSSRDMLRAFNGVIAIEVPEGAFALPTTISIRKVEPNEKLTDAALKRLSSTYEIDLGVAVPAKKLKLSIRYCPQCLMDTDHRKLGLYREDPENPGSYIYVGGKINPADGSVETLLSTFSRYAVLAYDRVFEDVVNHWAQAEIEIMASRYLVNGVSEKEFQPDRLITRAELAKLLVSMLSQDPLNARVHEVLKKQRSQAGQMEAAAFDDVDSAAWYYPWVQAASELGLVKGDGRNFRPDDPVTRQEMAVMIARALGSQYTKDVPGTSETGGALGALPFSDVQDISDWARDSVYAVWFWGLMKGMDGGQFQPMGNATRAQAAALVLRALELSGLVTVHSTLQGTLSMVEIEGRHFELKDAEGNIYVLLPMTEAARQGLKAVSMVPPDLGTPAPGSTKAPSADPASYKKVKVKGIVSSEPNQFMRGQIFRAISVEVEK